jgi:hypothetical protein
MENDVKVVYVTELVASGFMNGIVNMAFSTYQFIPEYQPPSAEDEGGFVVAPAPVLSANLRFDLRLAMILRDRLEALIEEHTKTVAPRATN